MCIRDRSFLINLKWLKIILVFKSDDLSLFSNYRPATPVIPCSWGQFDLFSATNASVNKHTDCNMKRFGTQTLCYISSRQITAPQDLFPLSAFSMVTWPPRKLKWSPISPFFMKVSDERRIVNAFGVYIGHKICHRVPATSATLLSRPAITMSKGPKDQKSRCPASKQVISCPMALK